MAETRDTQVLEDVVESTEIENPRTTEEAILAQVIAGEEVTINARTRLQKYLSQLTSGSSITVEALTVTENDTYTAPEGKAYSPVTVNVNKGYATPTVIRYVDYDYVHDVIYVLPYVPVGANVKYMLEIQANDKSFVCSSGIFEGPLPNLFYLASSVPVTIGAVSGILYMVFEKTGGSYTYKAYLGYSDVTNATNVGGVLYSYEWESYVEGGDI